MPKKIPPLLWVFLLPVLLGAPFVGRAYFVDDHYHMLMAKGLLENPLRPFDFKADDNGVDNAGWERGEPPRMVNPPLHHYLLALFWKAGGERLWMVRLFSLLIAGGTAVLIYLLAARLNVPPGPAAALAVLTPAFWLSSYALLIDSTLNFFFLGALWAWVEGLRRRSAGWLSLSGVLMGLTLVTKYTGVLLFPVCGLFWGVDRVSGRRFKPWLTFLIPTALFGLWCAWNMATYGAVHLLESSKRVMQVFSWGHVLIFLTFFSGVFWVPLLGWWEAGSRRATLVAFLGATALAVALASPAGGFTGFQSILMSALAVGGALFLWASLRGLRGARFSSDLFLVGWLLLGAVQMVYVMQWVAARYYLTVLVPTVFLACRMSQRRFAFSPVQGARARAVAAGAMFLATLGLGVGDYLQADTSRRVAQDAEADRWLAAGRRGFFLGDSFTASYLKGAGWRPAFQDVALHPGDLLFRQEIIMPPWWFRAERYPLRVLKTYTYSSLWPFRVMDNRGSAGFYASAWGALPFTISTGPLERYTLLEVLPRNENKEVPH